VEGGGHARGGVGRLREGGRVEGRLGRLLVIAREGRGDGGSEGTGGPRGTYLLGSQMVVVGMAARLGSGRALGWMPIGLLRRRRM
jgi:hypothetical protein